MRKFLELLMTYNKKMTKKKHKKINNVKKITLFSSFLQNMTLFAITEKKDFKTCFKIF